jgi:hypothetical protein
MPSAAPPHTALGSAPVVGTAWQVWAKPLGQRSHAVLFVATGSAPTRTLTIPYANVSAADFPAGAAACVYDLHDAAAPPTGPIDVHAHALASGVLGAHDSAFLCVSAAGAAADCAAAASRGACPV